MRIKTNYDRTRFEKRKGMRSVWFMMVRKGRGETEYGEVRFDRNRREFILDVTNFIEPITKQMSQELAHFLCHIKPKSIGRIAKEKTIRAKTKKQRAKAKARRKAA
ncbi:MAG: hypothetical protein C4570_02100 [Ammonifex sp.]|jgi:hypothetical protein|nr:MAG: hypothetical protein C4570_02100 [Ammonifex sp.]